MISQREIIALGNILNFQSIFFYKNDHEILQRKLLNSGLLTATFITGVKLDVRNYHVLIMSMNISANTRETR